MSLLSRIALVAALLVLVVVATVVLKTGPFGGLIERQFAGSPSLNALMRTTIAPTMIEGGGSAETSCPRALRRW